LGAITLNSGGFLNAEKVSHYIFYFYGAAGGAQRRYTCVAGLPAPAVAVLYHMRDWKYGSGACDLPVCEKGSGMGQG
jgi:hypothetical protein